MLLLDVADAASVRAALDSRLDDSDVSDDTVMLDIYAGVASDRVKEWRDSLNVAVPDDDPRLRRAAIYLTAALLAPNVPHLLSERTPDYQYTAQALTVKSAEERQSFLYGEAWAAVARAAGVSADAPPATGIFDVAPGDRGWLPRNAIYSETQVPGRLFW